jgi:hypothetical protein
MNGTIGVVFEATFRDLNGAFVRKALGSRLQAFADARKPFDPSGRLLNDYFRGLLADSSVAAGS